MLFRSQEGQPTWTHDLAELIVRLVDSGAPGGYYHGTSSGATSWHGFAQEIFRLSGLDPARVTVTNPPANAIRWNSANGYWEYWNGTAWGALAATFNIVAAQANKLKTPVAIAVSGDIAGSANFDGLQKFLDCVHNLTAERRLLRHLHQARRP